MKQIKRKAKQIYLPSIIISLPLSFCVNKEFAPLFMIRQIRRYYETN